MKLKCIIYLLVAGLLSSCALIDLSALRKSRLSYTSTQKKDTKHYLVGQLTNKGRLTINIDGTLVIDKNLSLSAGMQRSSASGVYENEPIIVNCHHKGYTKSADGTKCTITVGQYQVGILDFSW